MTETEYGQWVEHHRTLFWMRTEEDNRLFAAWFSFLKPYDLSEVVEASNWIAVNAASRFRTEHVALLHDRIRSERTRVNRLRRDAELADLNAGYVCRLCFGCGWVSVPHARWIVDGEWQRNGRSYPTMLVTCQCRRGQDRAESLRAALIDRGGKTHFYSLPEYAAMYPHWQEMAAEVAEARKQESAAMAHAQSVDRTHGQLDVGGIKERLAKMMDARKAVRA